MKKVFLTFLFFVSVCNSASAQILQFKNPIFYQPLGPLSKVSTLTFLTPTYYAAMKPLNDTIGLHGKCNLLENEQYRITLKCNLKGWRETYNWYLTYVIKGVSPDFPSCLRILEYTYSKPEDFPKDEMYAAKYCVTPPNYKPLKNN